MNPEAIAMLQAFKEAKQDQEINRDAALLPEPKEQLKSVPYKYVSVVAAIPDQDIGQLVVCPITGISININVPSIPGKILEYINPLSYYNNVAAIIKEGEGYLKKLPIDVLAGLYLVAYDSFGLLRKTSQTAAENNVLLRTAGKEILINALLAIGTITKSYADTLPQFSLDKSTHMIDGKSCINVAIQEYSKLILSTRYPQLSLISPTEAAALASIDSKYSSLNPYMPAKVATRAKKLGISDEEKEQRALFAENIKKGKELMSILLLNKAINEKFFIVLKNTLRKDILLGMGDHLRGKIVAKLQELGHAEAVKLAEIIEHTKDQKAQLDSLFEDIVEPSDADIASAKPQRKMSLAEILAAKRAGEM